jgi:hypothetical protein
MPRDVTPGDVRMLRQLGHEVRLALETATMNRQRFRPFLADAIQHCGLLVDLARVVLITCAEEHGKARTLLRWGHLELLAARGRRRVYHHRVAHVRDAIRMLGRFDALARALEARLWDG